MTKRTALALTALYLLLYILPLSIRPPQRPDELRYAEIPREMVASGDWTVPHLSGLRYFEKPPLAYWLTAISFEIFGENNFAMRLPSALATGFTALLLTFFAMRHFSSPLQALLAPGIFLTMAQVFALGVTNILDTILATCLTTAMIAFYEASQAKGRARRNALLALFGGACGLAFLAKGFLAFILPAIAIAPFLLFERRFKDLFTYVWIPLLAATLVVLPWSLAIHLREPDFWRYFFWDENVRRFVSPNAEHAGPFYFFIPKLLEGAIPWTFMLPAAFLGLRGTIRNNPPLRFALCWFLFPFLFFSMAHGKLPTYIQPCFAPLALLLSLGIDRYLASGRRRVFDGGAICLGSLLGITVLGFGVVQLMGLATPPIFSASETHLWLLASLAIGSWSLGIFLAARSREINKKLLLFVLAPSLFFVSVHFLTTIDAIGIKRAENFFLRSAAQTPPTSLLVVHTELIRSVGWYFKRTDAYLFENVDELGYGLRYDEASKARYLPDFHALAEFIAKPRSPETVITVLVETPNYEEGKEKLPEPSATFQDEDHTFLQFRSGSSIAKPK